MVNGEFFHSPEPDSDLLHYPLVSNYYRNIYLAIWILYVPIVLAKYIPNLNANKNRRREKFLLPGKFYYIKIKLLIVLDVGISRKTICY